MNKILEMKKIIKELNKASEAYYNGKEPLMTDAEFDLKLKKLSKLENEIGLIMSNSPTINVGSKVLNNLEKIKHTHKNMLSLEKVHSAEEVVKFARGQELIAMIKLDGLSVRLIYEEGKLIKAATRGNGSEGSLITNHVKHFKNVPLSINKKGIYVVDGEAIIDDKDFDLINASLPNGVEKFKNSRNLASGTLSLLDTFLVKERHLQFILWDVIVGDNSNEFYKRIENARHLGFTVVPAYTTELNRDSINECIDFIFKMSKECFYPNDGVVFKINDIKYGEKLGQTSHHFCNAIAYKATDETYETTLKEIEWNTTRTGLINPTAIFETVVIDGAEVSRATLHNVSYIEELELGIGDTIEVYKANMIIPKVHDNLTRSGNCILPETCPCCGTKTETHNENGSKTLHCPNPDCKAKFVSKLEHACSKYALNIDGMSGATVELLVDLGYVKTIDDLYRLEKYKDQLMKVKGLGKKSVEKLLENIEKSRTITMDKFLVALCIPNVGRTASKALSKYYNGDITSFIHHASSEIYYDFTVIPDFGEVTSKAINEFFSKNIQDISYLYEEMNFITETEQKNSTGIDLHGKTFCITGKLQHYSNRDALVSDIEGNNGKYVSSVTSKTNYLINNDVTSTSGKNAKAQKVGCVIISESDFMQMIGKTI